MTLQYNLMLATVHTHGTQNPLADCVHFKPDATKTRSSFNIEVTNTFANTVARGSDTALSLALSCLSGTECMN